MRNFSFDIGIDERVAFGAAFTSALCQAMGKIVGLGRRDLLQEIAAAVDRDMDGFRSDASAEAAAKKAASTVRTIIREFEANLDTDGR